MLGWNDKYAEDCFPKDKLAQVKTWLCSWCGGGESKQNVRKRRQWIARCTSSVGFRWEIISNIEKPPYSSAYAINS